MTRPWQKLIELRRGETGLDDQIFQRGLRNGGDLRAIDGFADALALVSETMDESPHANAINGLIGKSSTASSAQRDAAF
jgi:hypothetical protein